MGGEGAAGPLGGKALEESGRWYHTSTSASRMGLHPPGQSACWQTLATVHHGIAAAPDRGSARGGGASDWQVAKAMSTVQAVGAAQSCALAERG